MDLLTQGQRGYPSLREGCNCDEHVSAPCYGGLPFLRMFEHWLTTGHVWRDNTLRDVIDLDSHECLVAVTAYPTLGAVDIDVVDMMHNRFLSQRMPSVSLCFHSDARQIFCFISIFAVGSMVSSDQCHAPGADGSS
eukprot:6199189-Pleurochrysis_carterae.AAC.2